MTQKPIAPEQNISIHKSNKFLSLDEFIERSINIHGNKYSYSKFIYSRYEEKGVITCPIHGDFEQSPRYHLEGRGCWKCSHTYTQEEIIEKCIEAHGNKYDYSQINYTKVTEPITVICPKHGKFSQVADSHIRGFGCKKCDSESRCKPQEYFIERCRKVHGEKYDYSKSIYVKGRDKVIITCPSHGDFLQTPETHYSGKGCPQCGKEKLKKHHENRKHTQEEYIKLCNEKHNCIYDYSEVIYTGVECDINIICQVHGRFTQNAKSHLQGHGCYQCSRELTGIKNRLLLDEAILGFKEIHGERYDYSKVNYVDSNTKCTIICKKHGEFEQIPRSHSSGQGCPKCNLPEGERVIYNFLTRQSIEFKHQHKFETCRNPKTNKILYFDFFIPEYNLVIEFDGTYHCSPEFLKSININVPSYFTQNTYQNNKFRDSIKDKFCEVNSINLLRILFWNIESNKGYSKEEIEGILQKKMEYLPRIATNTIN